MAHQELPRVECASRLFPHHMARVLVALAAAIAAHAQTVPTVSVVTGLPADPSAVNANDPQFGLVGDGIADDTTGLAAAINATYAPGLPDCSQPGSRIVFLQGDGKAYRLSAPLILPMWVRLIGWGATVRPALVLAPGTPGYSNPADLSPLLEVVNWAPRSNCNRSANSGGNTAFGTGVINVDIRIGAHNPGAVGVSNGAAQGGVLRSMAFYLAPDAAAGVYSPGWAHQDLVFEGGRYGVLVNHTGAWPSILRDCVWSGQGLAAVAWPPSASQWEGLTLLRARISDAPAAFALNATALNAVRLTVIDSTFANISAALVVPVSGGLARLEGCVAFLHVNPAPSPSSSPYWQAVNRPCCCATAAVLECLFSLLRLMWDRQYQIQPSMLPSSSHACSPAQPLQVLGLRVALT